MGSLLEASWKGIGRALAARRLKTYLAGHLVDWGFALYRASSERYDDTPLPDGNPSGSPEQALDCALGLYLADPSAWINPPKD